MTISLCPVLMNFSMQITHLNQKWSPVLFVFRQLMRQENQKKKKTACLLLPFVSSDSFVLLCIFATANLQPLVSHCVCVVRWMEGHSCPDQTTEETVSDIWNLK